MGWFLKLDASLEGLPLLSSRTWDFHSFHEVFWVSFGNLCTRKALGHCFLKLDVSLRSMLFPGRELEDFHWFHQDFCVSFGNLGKWFFELNASLRSIPFRGGELKDFHRFHQVSCVSFENWATGKVLGYRFFKLGASLMGPPFLS